MRSYFWSVFVVSLLLGCSSGGDTGGSECVATNTSIDPACNECLRSQCCAELSACVQGTACNMCVTGSTCTEEGQTDFDAFSECFVGQCSEACGVPGAGGSSGTAGTGTGGGGSTGGTEMGAAGETAGGTGGSTPTCTDADAPGQLPSDPLALSATSDCNNTPLKHTGERLSADDSDWFSYDVADEAGCVIEGSASVVGGDVELCAFGDLPNCEVTCTTGTPTGRGGYNGCCTSGDDPKLSWGTGCGIGESASGTMYLQVSATGSACLAYELTYGF